jgi:hypothetical protein
MLGIILGSIAIFVFGAFWFTVLFGKTWAKLMDFNPAGDAKAKQMGMGKSLAMNFLSNVVIATSLYFLFPQLLATSFTDLLKIVYLMWLAFSFPIYANAAIWERKTWKLVLINSAQGLISATIVSAIIYYI